MASYDYHYKNQVKSLKPKLNEEIKASNKTFESQKKAVTDNYNYQINEAEKAYADDYRENAIQKIVNERAVAENMANMGLRDSGLNRTQMTATQLSYGNNKAKIDRQKQAQVDALAQTLAASLSEIDINKSNAAASIRQSYDSLASQNATALAKADTEAATERYKADIALIKDAAEKKAESEDKKEAERKNAYEKIKTKLYDYHDSYSSHGSSVNGKEGAVFDVIYSYALDWDVDLDENTYTNSEIRSLLSAAGMTEERWKYLVLKKNDAFNLSFDEFKEMIKPENAPRVIAKFIK